MCCEYRNPSVCYCCVNMEIDRLQLILALRANSEALLCVYKLVAVNPSFAYCHSVILTLSL